MFNSKVKPKVIGYLMLIPAFLLLCLTLFGILVLPIFGISSGVSLFQMLPFVFVMIFSLSLILCCIYLSFRYFKEKPFKKNKSLGVVLIGSSVFYLMYSIFGYLASNFFLDNEGGFLKPIIALLYFLIFFPLGLGFKNGYK